MDKSQYYASSIYEDDIFSSSDYAYVTGYADLGYRGRHTYSIHITDSAGRHLGMQQFSMVQKLTAAS